MAKIKIPQGGPIIIEADLVTVIPKGDGAHTHANDKIALCRCGHSQSKPFCDGAHLKHEETELPGAEGYIEDFDE